jgi:ABC-type glycerol-3-phosphate transport system substrate-binding protein
MLERGEPVAGTGSRGERPGLRLPFPIALCLGALAGLVGVQPVAAQSGVLTVWDFKSEEPLMKPYFAHVINEFKARHPGVQVREIAQPESNYQTVLGTAVSAGQGPDVALLHGGEQALQFADAFVSLTTQVADLLPELTGANNFQRKDGSYVGLPISVQGVIIYYNKDVYRSAGLNPDAPPLTWDDLAADCKMIAEHTKAACFGLGNKAGVGFSGTIDALMTGTWPLDVRSQFMARELSWTSQPARGVFEKFQSMVSNKWIEPGANSYSPYTDLPRMFAGGRVANMLGLVSDAPNAWKNLEQLIGVGNVGVAMPVAVGVSPQQQSKRLTVSGGIGFGVTRWSANKDLAIDYVKIAAAADSELVFMDSAGGMPANTKVDTSRMASPVAKQILGFLNCCALPNRVQDTFLPEERQEMQRDGELMISGQISVDETLNRLEQARNSAKAHRTP